MGVCTEGCLRGFRGVTCNEGEMGIYINNLIFYNIDLQDNYLPVLSFDWIKNEISC